MTHASELAYLEALNMGILKGMEHRVLLFLQKNGPHTWQEVQAKLERIHSKRYRDSVINSPMSKLNKEGKLRIIGEKYNEVTGFMNSIYEAV